MPAAIVHIRAKLWPVVGACGLRIQSAERHHRWTWDVNATNCPGCQQWLREAHANASLAASPLRRPERRIC